MALIGNTYINQRSFLGVAAEATIGTPLAATQYVQLLSDDITVEPGILLPKLMRQSRSVAFVPAIGEQKVVGNVEVPLFVDQGMILLAALVGTDTFQNSTAAGTTVAIGGAGLASGATQFQIATQTSTPIAASDYIQIQQASGAPADTNLSEIHKVASVSGAGPYTIVLTSPEALNRAYTATGVVARIPAATAVFTHTLHPDQPNAGTYKTLTIEKNRAGMDSRQYAGCTVTKGSLKLVSNDVAKITYSIIGLADVNLTPSTPTFGTSAPLALATFAASAFGSNDISVKTFDLDVDQKAKEMWTFNQSNFPSAIPPTEREIKGKWTNVVQNSTYYTNAVAATTGALVLTFTQGTSTITITFPKFQIMKPGQPLRAGQVFIYDIDYQCDYDDTTGRDMQVVVVNSSYLAFF